MSSIPGLLPAAPANMSGLPPHTYCSMLTENVVMLAGNPTPAPHIFCSVAMLASMRVHWIAGAPSARKRHADAQVAYPIPHSDVRLEGREERSERWRARAQDLDPYAVARAGADVSTRGKGGQRAYRQGSAQL
jgi:hypothetical protein